MIRKDIAQWLNVAEERGPDIFGRLVVVAGTTEWGWWIQQASIAPLEQMKSSIGDRTAFQQLAYSPGKLLGQGLDSFLADSLSWFAVGWKTTKG